MNRYAAFAAVLTAAVVTWRAASAAAPSASGPTASAPDLARRLETEIVGPLRERHLGWAAFSRAGPRWDADSLCAVVEGRDPGSEWTCFRVAAFGRRPVRGQEEVLWLGRVHATSGRIELARPQPAAGTGLPWRPASDVIGPPSE